MSGKPIKFTRDEILEANPQALKAAFKLIDCLMEKDADGFGIYYGLGEIFEFCGPFREICYAYVDWKYPGFDWTRQGDQIVMCFDCLDDHSADARYEEIFEEFVKQFSA